MQDPTNNRASQKPMDANKLDLRNEIQEAYGKQPISWFEWLFRLIDIPENSHVLELGCGTGRLWLENAQRVRRSWKLLLTDKSPAMLRSTRKNMEDAHLSASLSSVDGIDLPFESERFDVVLAIGVLDQVGNLNRALSEAWRVLTPGGTLITSAGGRKHMHELKNFLRRHIPEYIALELGGNEDRFGLENGEENLVQHFEEVVQYHYNDQMEFHELQPVLDYVFSEDIILQSFTIERMGQFVFDLKQELHKHGAFYITVQKGLFLARKKVVEPLRQPF